MDKGKEVAVQGTDNGLAVVDLAKGTFPNLEKAKAAPIDLMADYWTPTEDGETKRMYFDRLGMRQVLGQENEVIDRKSVV